MIIKKCYHANDDERKMMILYCLIKILECLIFLIYRGKRELDITTYILCECDTFAETKAVIIRELKR